MDKHSTLVLLQAEAHHLNNPMTQLGQENIYHKYLTIDYI